MEATHYENRMPPVYQPFDAQSVYRATKEGEVIMHTEQRSAFDEMLAKLRTGRMTRRTFLERTLAIGFASTTITSLLESCSGGSGSNITHLIWQSELDITTAYQDIVEHYNNTNTDNIRVTLRAIPGGTDDLTAIERNLFRAHSAAADIYSIDIVFVPELASQQWSMPISESQWPASTRAQYLQAPLQACTFNGQVWAAPYRTDVGLIYYRTDLVDTPPRTWDDLTTLTQSVFRRPHPEQLQYGYVWQGSQYEGLVCNFDEVLHGYGGSILAPDDPTTVTVDSPEARQALNTMVGWTNNIPISPPNTDTYTEDVARQTWEDGKAIFMRNWPYVYVHAQGTKTQKTQVTGKFDIHPMLYGGSNTVGHSSIGGWQLAINSFTDPDKQAAAWKFIQYMLGREAQEKGAREAGWLVTLQDIYTDRSIGNEIPLFKKIGPILQTAKPRPLTPRYEEVSQKIQIHVRRALNKTVSVSQALQDLASALKPLVASSNGGPS